MMTQPELPTSVAPDEMQRFAAMAESWWDPDGKFKPLHLFNPVRLAFIRDQACAHFGRDPKADRPLAGLTLLDIGCGGGLLSEPMARLGAAVTGIDALDKNIQVASLHARQSGLPIDYRAAPPEALAASGERFDIVLNMEVIEHVADRDAFLAASAAVLAPGGGMVFGTMNRTPKSYALAIVGAEKILHWLPPGTHQWRKFVRPSELAAGLRRHGLTLGALTGVSFDPWRWDWHLGKDLDVNYLAFFYSGS